MVFLTNAGSLPRALGQALLDIMIAIEALSVARKHKGIPDQISADLSEANRDHVHACVATFLLIPNTKSCRHSHWFSVVISLVASKGLL